MNNILLTPMLAAIQGAEVVPEGLFDKLIYGLQVAAIGIGIVFAILAIIMGVLYLFELLFYRIPMKKAAQPAEPVAKPAPAAAAPVAVTAPVENDDEVVAVISAAIAAYYEQNAPASRYKIKSFRRI